MICDAMEVVLPVCVCTDNVLVIHVVKLMTMSEGERDIVSGFDRSTHLQPAMCLKMLELQKKRKKQLAILSTLRNLARSTGKLCDLCINEGQAVIEAPIKILPKPSFHPIHACSH